MVIAILFGAYIGGAAERLPAQERVKLLPTKEETNESDYTIDLKDVADALRQDGVAADVVRLIKARKLKDEFSKTMFVPLRGPVQVHWSWWKCQVLALSIHPGIDPASVVCIDVRQVVVQQDYLHRVKPESPAVLVASQTQRREPEDFHKQFTMPRVISPLLPLPARITLLLQEMMTKPNKE